MTFISLGIYFLIGIVLTAFVLFSPTGNVYYPYPMESIFRVIAWPLWLAAFISCSDFGCAKIVNSVLK